MSFSRGNDSKYRSYDLPQSPIQPYLQAHLHQYNFNPVTARQSLQPESSRPHRLMHRLMPRLPEKRNHRASSHTDMDHLTGPYHLQIPPLPVLPILNSSPNCRSSPQDCPSRPRVFVAFGPILPNYCMLVPYHPELTSRKETTRCEKLDACLV